jgi:hypothetical protein
VPDADHKLRIFNLVDLFEMSSDSLAGKMATDFVYSG